jgi:predicted peroxiredoxin
MRFAVGRPLRAAALTLALGMALVPAAAPVAAAEEARPIFYNLTSDDAWTAGMALAQARTAAERGHAVTVFLNVRAVRLADRDAAQGSFGPTGRTPAEMLAGLVEAGHTVLVCGVCMKVGGMAPGDLIEGAEMASPDLTFGAMTAPETVVMSY